MKILRLVLGLLAVTAPLAAQNANLSGTVYDPTGNPLPAVTVTLENPTLGYHHSQITAKDGLYSFDAPEGEGYVVTAERYGKTLDVRSGIQLVAGEQRIVLPPLKEKQVSGAPPRVRMAESDVKANLEKEAEPLYPKMAMAAGIQGPVEIEALIAPDGSVQNVQVVSGNPLLRQAAIDAVKLYHYKPFYQGGRAAEVETQITVNFHLTVVTAWRLPPEATADKPATDGNSAEGKPVAAGSPSHPAAQPQAKAAAAQAAPAPPATKSAVAVAAAKPAPPVAKNHPADQEPPPAHPAALEPVVDLRDPNVALLAKISSLTSDDMPALVHNAVAGDPQAQYMLGAAFELGQGPPQDFTQAAQWYAKSAAQAYGPAEFALAELTAAGRGVARNDAAAVDLYTKAALQGYHLAERTIGYIYHAGLLGTPQDVVHAHEWLEKAGVLPDSQASTFTGTVVDAAGRPVPGATVVLANPSLGYARGASTDAAGKFHFALAPPAQGYVLSSNRDGGKLVTQSGITLKSADGGDFAGPLRLPVTPEFVAATQKAAAGGDPGAQYLMASWLISGKNLPQNANDGWQWMRSAAERGSGAAQRELGFAYLRGDGMENDPVSAYVWLAVSGTLTPSDQGELDQLSARLTRAQLSEAKRRVQRWKATHETSAKPEGGQ